MHSSRESGEFSPKTDFNELATALVKLRSKEEMVVFLRELWTPGECNDFAKRWALMKELLKGTPQREIARKLQTSLCKVTRGVQYAKSASSPLRRQALAALETRVPRNDREGTEA